MRTTYTAVLSSPDRAELATADFGRIRDCVRWAERHDTAADRVDIYSPTGRRTAQYRRPRSGSYPEALGVWVNSKLY